MKELFLNTQKDANKIQLTVDATEKFTSDKRSARNCNRIYIRSTRRWVPVSKEYYETYMRDVHTFRNRQYRQGFCKCPGTKEYMCDCDCLTCPFYKKDAMESLDAPIIDDEGNEETLMDRLVDENTLTPEETLLEKDERESLYRAIARLNPTQQTVIRMMLKEKAQTEIAEALGIKTQSTVSFHKDRAVEILRRILITD